MPISTHAAANLAATIRAALKRQIIDRMDSTVVLHRLKEQGNYELFAENRAKNTLIHKFIEWKYVPTKQNPRDIGSRSSPACKLGDSYR